MKNQKSSPNNESELDQETIEKDLAQLYNYPSIGKLFSTEDLTDLENLRTKLNATREQLDTIIRRGTVDEADKASKASEAINLTLNFLQYLEQKRKNITE